MAPRSTVVLNVRTRPGPRWPVLRAGAIRAVDPTSNSALPEAVRRLRVDAPLKARVVANLASTPKPRLFPLVPERVTPVLLPTALKLTLTVAVAEPRMSGPFALVFAVTAELATLIVPALVEIRAIPPPPVP